jgi:hypothetical protein
MWHTFLEFFKLSFVTQPLQNPRYVAVLVKYEVTSVSDGS